jgi:hypothetical protein
VAEKPFLLVELNRQLQPEIILFQAIIRQLTNLLARS